MNLGKADLTEHQEEQVLRDLQDPQAKWDLKVSQLIQEVRVKLVTQENQDHEDLPGTVDLRERKGSQASKDLPAPLDLQVLVD